MSVMVDGRVHEDSSRSRLWKHNLSHDCNAMSARPSRPVVYLQFNGEPIQHYREGSGSTTAGFWVKGNRVYPLDQTHIGAIMDNPQLFGIAKEIIDATFERHGERRRSEGKARAEIIRTVARHGWVRVRHYSNRGSDYWSIQVDDVRSRRRVIEDAVMSLIERGHMSLHDELNILGYDCGTRLVYGYQDGGALNVTNTPENRSS